MCFRKSSVILTVVSARPFGSPADSRRLDSRVGEFSHLERRDSKFARARSNFDPPWRVNDANENHRFFFFCYTIAARRGILFHTEKRKSEHTRRGGHENGGGGKKRRGHAGTHELAEFAASGIRGSRKEGWMDGGRNRRIVVARRSSHECRPRQN